MPIINITLPETVESVSRPIIYAVLTHLRSVLSIEPDVQVIFPGDLHKTAQAGSTIDNPLRSPNLANDRYLFIEVDAQMDPYALATTAVNQAEHPIVFYDSKLQVSVAPIYVTTDVSLNVKYRTPSRTEALRWQDDLRVRLSQMQDIHLHKVQYHYQLPAAYWEILECIYDTREEFAGYGDSFTDYIKSHGSDRLTLISDIAGQDPCLAVAEVQSRIQGRYAFDAIPEKPEREDNGTYTATLSYKFSYERPVSASMRYPIMVHNQLLPPEYVLYTLSNTNADAAPQQYSRSLAALSHFEAINQGLNQANIQGFLTIPLYDQFLRPSEVPYTGTVFYALCSIDTTDQRTLVNLEELGDVEIDKDIMQFIKESEYPYMHKLYMSILQIHLYRDTALAHYDSIQCDSQATIKATYDLNYRIPHRVRFSIVTDWSVLDPDALARLRRYPKVLLKILRTIDELFFLDPYMTWLFGNRPNYNERELRKLFENASNTSHKNGVAINDLSDAIANAGNGSGGTAGNNSAGNGRGNGGDPTTATGIDGSGFGNTDPSAALDDSLLKLLGNRSLMTVSNLKALGQYLFDKNKDGFGFKGDRGTNLDFLRSGYNTRTQLNTVFTSYIVSIRQDLYGQVTDDMLH